MSSRLKLKVLQQEWSGCTRCPLHETRGHAQVAFGTGSPRAKYLIVGQAPTESDYLAGNIYAGREGLVILEALKTAGIRIDECYFTYAVSCRPTMLIPATESEPERTVPRVPAKEELSACRTRLYEILYLVDPRVVISLGEHATKTMVRGRLPKFTEAVGRRYDCTLHAATPEDRAEGKTAGKSRYFDTKYPVYAVPDTTTILGNPSSAAHGPHAVMLNTLIGARTYVDFVLKNEEKTMAKEVSDEQG